MDFFIVPTSQAIHLAKIIAKKTDIKIIYPKKYKKERKRYFPDGEVYLKIPEIGLLKRKRIIVLHSGRPRLNSGLIELEMVLEILKITNLDVEIFFSYFP